MAVSRVLRRPRVLYFVEVHVRAARGSAVCCATRFFGDKRAVPRQRDGRDRTPRVGKNFFLHAQARVQERTPTKRNNNNISTITLRRGIPRNAWSEKTQLIGCALQSSFVSPPILFFLSPPITRTRTPRSLPRSQTKAGPATLLSWCIREDPAG